MQIRDQIEVAAPPEVLFDLLHDYFARKIWDPFTPVAEILNADAAQKGAIVGCVDTKGRTMVTEYRAYQRPTVATIRMLEGPWPFLKFGGCWRIVHLNRGAAGSW